MVKQIGVVIYIECLVLQLENSVRDIFYVVILVCVNKINKNVKWNKLQRVIKWILYMFSRLEFLVVVMDL